MLNTKVADLKRVSKVYRDRLVAAGFRTLQDVIDGWESEKFWDVAGRRLDNLKRRIESEVREQGYEIVPRYELRLRRQ
jgi:hypothetical protein